MAINKMNLEYLLGVLVKQGLVPVDRKGDIEASFREKKRILTREKSRNQAGPVRGSALPPDDLDILVSLQLPHPRGNGGSIDDETIMRAVAKDVDLPFRKIDHLELDLDLVTRILPRSFAQKHLIVPVGLTGDTLELAVSNPFDKIVLEDVRRVSDYHLAPVLATKDEIKKLIAEFYGFQTSIRGAEGQLVGPAVDLGDLEQFIRLKSTDEIQATDQHVKNAVDYLFSYAFEQKASDIHIEPKRNESLIRMRLDGVLHHIHRLPKVLHPAMVSRIKTISRLDIAEKRRPQDGRIKIGHKGREAEIRVSTVPTAFGEKAVLRILDPELLFRKIDDLFPFPEDFEKYKKFLRNPYGIILVTGPTGSGKSTTLYSSLRSLSNEAVNITTVEDPIEMVHEEFNQIGVQPLIGVTFATILRNILRQDPDIIMIGEMRDHETTQHAIQAALTGHLVLSTLHTNDAPSAITRLIDLGAEPFLVSSTVIGVVAQRLLRRICIHCKESFILDPLKAEALGLKVKAKDSVKLWRGQGCEHCRGTGYLGRMATLEVMPFSDRIRELTIAGSLSQDLKKTAVREGMITLRENALKLMLRGDTTYEEVLRVTVDE